MIKTYLLKIVAAEMSFYRSCCKILSKSTGKTVDREEMGVGLNIVAAQNGYVVFPWIDGLS